MGEPTQEQWERLYNAAVDQTLETGDPHSEVQDALKCAVAAIYDVKHPPGAHVTVENAKAMFRHFGGSKRLLVRAQKWPGDDLEWVYRPVIGFDEGMGHPFVIVQVDHQAEVKLTKENLR